MTTTPLTPKLPGETVAYMADWSRQLGDDCIETHTLTVSAGTVTITEQQAFPQFVRFVVAGGANGETASFDHQIITRGGQTLQRVMSLVIADGVTAIVPTTMTKRAVVNMAFEEIGLAGYEFDATPEEQFSALRKLDALMAEWAVSSLDVGYNFPTVMGQGDLEDPAGIPDLSLNAIAAALALRIMPAIGKTMSAETRVALAQGMVALRTYCAKIPERSLAPGTSRGAGNKPWSTWNPFIGREA